MALIISNPIEGTLEHITIYEYRNEGSDAVVMRRLVAHEGYAMYNTTVDTGVDEEGNPNPPTYVYTAYLPTSVPVTNYVAVLIEEGMEVVGQPTTPPEAEVV